MPDHAATVQLFVTLVVKPHAWDGYLAAMQAEAAGARSEPGNLVQCFALSGTYRSQKKACGKARLAANAGGLGKRRNAAASLFLASRRASRQGAICFVAWPWHGSTMPAATRRAAGPLATRYKYLTARNTALAFDLLVDPAAPHTMYLLEHWASLSALEQEHARQPYYIHVRGLEATALTGEFEERHLQALDPRQPYPAGVKSRAAASNQVRILQGGDAAALALLDAAFAQAAEHLRTARGNHAALLFANADRAGERLLVQSWDSDTARHAAWSTGAARALARVIETTSWGRREALALVDRASA